MSSWQERFAGFVGDLFSTDVEGNGQTLLVQSNKGTIYESRLQDLNLSEQTSNGSFISDDFDESFDAYLQRLIRNLNLRNDKKQ